MYPTNVMFMNNENEHSASYRRLSDSTPSPILRRSKSVRASFRMLGSRWKSSNSSSSNGSANTKITNASGAVQQQKQTSTSKDIVSERFGKDFNRNVKQPMTHSSDRFQLMVPSTSYSSSPPMPQSNPSIKSKTKFFHAFAKENVSERHNRYEIPKNVAPKAAALLQIPVLPYRRHAMNSNSVSNSQYSSHHRHEHRRNHDLIKMDGKFNVHLDSNSCALIANSNQFALLKSSSEPVDTSNHIQSCPDMFKPATIRRTPYWPNNHPPMKYSKNLAIFLVSLFV